MDVFRKAAKVYRVLETTLRDRILGNIYPDTVTTGKDPLFDLSEDDNLVKHIKKQWLVAAMVL